MTNGYDDDCMSFMVSHISWLGVAVEFPLHCILASWTNGGIMAYCREAKLRRKREKTLFIPIFTLGLQSSL